MQAKEAWKLVLGSVVVYVIMAACASGVSTLPVPAAKADTTTSGSRLKARNYVGSDGSKQFWGWHDSMVNADCSFLPASDGTTRCLPVGVGTATGGYFSDPGCSQPLAQAAKGCSPAMYTFQIVVPATTGCVPTDFYRLYSVSSPYSGPIYTGTPASCTAEPNAGTTADFYSAGAEIPPSTFVAATLQTDP